MNFLSMPFGTKRNTLCAEALPPSTELSMQLLVLKLITATCDCDVKLGATANVLQLMVASNESFNIMLRGFPKITKAIVKPYHVGYRYSCRRAS